jgi:hypothetical protein
MKLVEARETRCGNPNGIASYSPRLARQRLPWGIVKQIINHNVVVANVARDGQNEMAATALRLGMLVGRLPRVARAAQPWALGRNSVGIHGRRDDATGQFRRNWLMACVVARVWGFSQVTLAG